VIRGGGWESRKKNEASSSAEYKVSALRIAEKQTVEKPSVADFASAQRRLTVWPCYNHQLLNKHPIIV
jgi:hypothetical protein